MMRIIYPSACWRVYPCSAIPVLWAIGELFPAYVRPIPCLDLMPPYHKPRQREPDLLLESHSTPT